MQNKVVIESFKSLEEYIDVISSRSNNEVFKDKNSSKTNDYDFTLTDSYEESLILALKGYQQGLEEISAVNFIPKHTEKGSRNLQCNDVVGYAPHVPNAIKGLAQSMITKKPTEQTQKVITILYNSGGSHSTSTDTFLRAGRNLISIINTLEKRGYRVGLFVMDSFCDNQYCFVIIKIKDYRQPSNLLKMAYPLIHPSFFRRQGFRWLETQPKVADYGLRYGYGKVILHQIKNRQERYEYIKEVGLVQQNWFYTELKIAANMTADELIADMKIK
jgi:hypothetical protein